MPSSQHSQKPVHCTTSYNSARELMSLFDFQNSPWPKFFKKKKNQKLHSLNGTL